MKIESVKAIYNEVADNWINLDRNVSHIHGEAEDNAIATCRENGGSAWFEGTNVYNEEFYMWYLSSLETILACSDFVTHAGRAFFESRNVKY